MANRKIGVVLFQLGGPDSPEAIEPFLYNLFSDPDIIDFPFARIARRPLARLISSARARHVQHHYGVMGGFSPIRRHTERQAEALEQLLNAEGAEGREFKTVVAMRYWHPFTVEAIAQLRDAECDQLVLLPLYPHFSSTTTGSSLNEWWRCSRHLMPMPSAAKAETQGHTNGAAEAASFRMTTRPSIQVIEDFYRDPAYLDSLIERINEALSRFPAPDRAELVFSAHSVPVAVIERGDPYQRHIEETVSLLMRRAGWPNRHRLCYQSKVGASRWLQPSLRSTIRELAAAGVKDVCVVPVSFVSDHVETLGEIDHEARELATGLGIERFEMSAGLNDSPRFITALAGLVLRAAGAKFRQEDFVAAD